MIGCSSRRGSEGTLSAARTTQDAEILAGIASVAAAHLDLRRPIEPRARLVEDLELDSLQLMTLAAEVENHFRVVLDPDDEEAIATVQDLVRVVGSKLGEAS